jgi:uncharacterized repeat protein (TIGR04138 family)
MSMHYPKLEAVVQRDPRYAYEAYVFLFEALKHTYQMLDRVPPPPNPSPDEEDHVTVPELLAGIRDLALREFGLMARTVFHAWGLHTTADFGELVFNLVEAGLMMQTSEDDRKEFIDVFDLDEALSDYRIELEEEAEGTP